MYADLMTHLPILAVEQEALLSKQGDITLAFQWELPELFTLSDRDYEALHGILVKAIRVLPVRAVWHKQDWFCESVYQPQFAPEQSYLHRSSERFFAERPFLDHRCYLFLSLRPEHRRPSSSLFSTLLRPSLVPPEALKPRVLAEFRSQVGQCVRILEDSGFFRLRPLSEADLLGTKECTGVLESYLTLQPPGSRPLLRDISYQKGLRIGEFYTELYTLADAADLPAYCGSRINYDRYSTDKTKFSVGFASPLGQLLSCNHLYNQYLFLDDPHKTIKALEARRLRLQSLAAYSRANAVSREATNEFLNEAIRDQRLPIKAHFNLLVWTAEEHRRRELRNLVSSALAQMDAVPRLEREGAPLIHWAGIPGNAADLPAYDTFDTFAEPASCFLNLETAYRSSPSPIGLRLGDRLTGRPLHVDLSDEPVSRGIITNRNKFILGPSGSGKSFFTNHMVRSYYEQGCHIVLVDVGHSYQGLCRLVGGYYFTYAEDAPIRFNPFYLEDGQAPDTEKRESIKTLLLALWKRDTESYNRSEYVALSTALQLYYVHLERHPAIFPCFDSFYEFLEAEYVAVLQRDRVQEKEFDVANFLYVLRPFYRGGEFDFLLNARDQLSLRAERFIVFELDNIKDHPILFPVVTIIIMEVFISKMRKLKGVRKMILIEEAWKAIAREGMAEYIKYLFKTVRKFFGEAVVVTQEVEDIISSPVVKQAIINNSDCKILLDQSKYQNKFDAIQELLGLTDKEKALVLSLNKANEPLRRYKEVFISLGGTLSKVYRVEVSPQEYLAYTTEEREKVQVAAEAARQGGDYERAIALLTRQEESEDPTPKL